MLEIVLDTETTGLDPQKGDRIVEIGCVELRYFVPTGRTFQAYINPQFPMSEGATRVSGLTNDFLKNHPLFHEVVDNFLAFIGDAPLVIHNAAFDMKFLNAELNKAGRPLIHVERAIDTLDMARRLFPGSPASLDALCKRFNIDLKDRSKHGALLDCQLLAQVYLELKGGPQAHLSFQEERQAQDSQKALQRSHEEKETFTRPYPWHHHATDAERLLHQELLKTLKNPLWERYQN